MSLSANITAAESYRAYVQDFAQDLITRAFYTPKTAQFADVRENIKGRLTMTRLKTAANKAVAWSKDFAAATDAITFSPRHLDVVAIKRDLSFVPQEFEASYLGFMRRAGQNPGEDLPFEGFVLQALLATHAEELESAFWAGVKAGSVTPGTTPMNETFDGFLELIKDAITATDLPGAQVIATPGGSITTANVVGLLETMWNALGAGYKEGPVDIFMSWANFQKYQQGYRTDFGKYVSTNKDATVTLDFSQNARLIPMPGMGASNRIVMTPGRNLVIGYDQISDQMFEFEKNKRVMDFWLDFKVGVQIAQLDEGAIIVNDLV
jgi:hypothetical protein